MDYQSQETVRAHLLPNHHDDQFISNNFLTIWPYQTAEYSATFMFRVSRFRIEISVEILLILTLMLFLLSVFPATYSIFLCLLWLYIWLKCNTMHNY